MAGKPVTVPIVELIGYGLHPSFTPLTRREACSVNDKYLWSTLPEVTDQPRLSEYGWHGKD